MEEKFLGCEEVMEEGVGCVSWRVVRGKSKGVLGGVVVIGLLINLLVEGK